MPNRVSVSLEHEAASIRQILDAGNYLDGGNLPRFDRRFVGGAHLAFYRSVFALARSAYFLGSNQYDADSNPKTRPRDGVRNPGNAALAGVARRHSQANEDVDLACLSLAGLRNFCDRRRVSSVFRAIAHSGADRRNDRHLRGVSWTSDLLDVRD
jgi:hypothetical protein